VKDPYIPMVAYTEEQVEELAYGTLRVILEESVLRQDFDIGLERVMRKRRRRKVRAGRLVAERHRRRADDVSGVRRNASDGAATVEGRPPHDARQYPEAQARGRVESRDDDGAGAWAKAASPKTRCGLPKRLPRESSRIRSCSFSIGRRAMATTLRPSAGFAPLSVKPPVQWPAGRTSTRSWSSGKTRPPTRRISSASG
jgi:hypothetical protein